jgi:hypothetical protein
MTRSAPRHVDSGLALASGLAGFALLAAVDRIRVFDRDEGYHAMAADLVRQGWWPWRDFLYLHPPGLAWLLAPFGGDPFLLRWVAAVFGGLNLALLVGALSAWYGRRPAILAGLLVACHPFFLSWMGTVKTYPFAGAATLAAMLLLAELLRRDPEDRSPAVLAGSALLLGVAIAIRLPCLALAPLGAGWLVASDRSRRGAGGATLFVALAVIPPLAAFWTTGASWPQMWFNAISSHNEPVANAWEQRIDTLLDLLRDPQVLLPMAAGSVAPWWHGLRGRSGERRPDVTFPLSVAVILTIGYLLARPTYSQYWIFALPFWIWCMTPWLSLASTRSKRARPIAAVLLVLWLAATLSRFERIVSPHHTQKYFSRIEVENVRREIRRTIPPGTVVASIWPGYLAGTGRPPLPGLENTLGFFMAAQLSAGQRRAFHTLSIEEYRERLRVDRPVAVVVTTEDVQRYPFLQNDLAGYPVSYSTEEILLLCRTP